MRISRNWALALHFLLDECVPPLLRDRRFFIWIPFKLAFREKAWIFFGFKEKANSLTKREFREIYSQARPVFVDRETDLNASSLRRIEDLAVGPSILDAGCGTGFLSRRLAARFAVTAADMQVPPSAQGSEPEASFCECDLERLPFGDQQFDTVVCAHTIEHLLHPESAIAELRRVCARRMIIVVPRQRPYRYTFDLHLQFFPYASDLLRLMRPSAGDCELRGGDWLYVEDMA